MKNEENHKRKENCDENKNFIFFCATRKILKKKNLD